MLATSPLSPSLQTFSLLQCFWAHLVKNEVCSLTRSLSRGFLVKCS